MTWPRPLKEAVLALQFLSRLPVPAVPDFNPSLMAGAANYFALAGLIIGSLLGLAAVGLTQLHIDTWVQALLLLGAWVWITGGLHLDGAADLADALGAAHRRPERFEEVLKDPHLGSFGVITLIMVLLAKLILLHAWLSAGWSSPCLFASLALIPAWMRFCAVLWPRGQKLPASGSSFLSWKISTIALLITLTVLLGASFMSAPALLLAPFFGFAWWLFLKYKVPVLHGDALGAGIEYGELFLLLGVLLTRSVMTG